MRAWSVAITVSVVVVAALEVSWRQMGYRTHVSETEEFWALHRGSVYARSDRDSVVVLLGASRLQMGLSLSRMSFRLPHVRPVQLAITGAHSGPALGDLAEDPDFSGRVLVSITPFGIIMPFGETQRYVEHFRSAGTTKPIDAWANGLVQSVLVAQNSFLSLPQLVRTLGNGRGLPDRLLAPMSRDRSRHADFSLMSDIAGYKEGRVEAARADLSIWEGAPPSISEFRDSVDVLNSQIERIRMRGGDVALVHFPLGPDWSMLNEQYFPRETFWKILENSTSAVTVHYLDWPKLQSFDLPDESHLDQKDMADFTDVLIDILVSLEFF